MIPSQELVQTWRMHPGINPTIRFPIWICHQKDDGQHPHIQSVLQSPVLQPYLATQLDLLQHLRVRFKVVRNHHHHHHPYESTRKVVGVLATTTTTTTDPPTGTRPTTATKIILLHPATPRISQLPVHVQTLLHSMGCSDAHPDNNNNNNDNNVDSEPSVVVHFQYHQFTASYLLNQLLPVAVHPVPTAFETVGHVAHLNLKPHHFPYRQLIGEVLYETLPNIETVIQKIGDVSGPFRTFQYEVLAGKPNHTLVQLVESGASLQFDLQHVYWCSRLSEERQRLLHQELLPTSRRSRTTGPTGAPNRTIVVADVFCGVGALCLQAAMAHAHLEVWANDWNPYATAAFRTNAVRNGVSHQVTRLTTGDAYQFLMDLGMTTAPPSPLATLESDATPDLLETTKVGPVPLGPAKSTSRKSHPRRRYHRMKSYRNARNQEYETIRGEVGVIRLPDHVVMNFPLEAPKFLGALRWWPANACGDGHETDDHPTPDNNHSHGSSNQHGRAKPRIHVYTFARNWVVNDNNNSDDNHEDDPDPADRSVEEIAVDLVADQLLPQLSPQCNHHHHQHSDRSTTGAKGGRRHELNDVYQCHVRTHIVRDVAPGKVVVCVSFTVTSKLLRHMRGDFL